MPGHDIIVIGASAGGVETLIQLVQGLPADLPASIFVTLHIPAEAPSVLPKILSRRGPLRALHPADGDPILPGHIYVACADHHLLVTSKGVIHVVRGPKENGHRPAVDPLFRSAAQAFGGRVIGVILSGALDDGTAGLAAVKACGGIAVVQDPKDALYSGMPKSAIANVDVDHIVSISELAPLLTQLASLPASEATNDDEKNLLEQESSLIEMRDETFEHADRPGIPSEFGCPDCGGTLWQISEEGLIRFRCRTGHAYSADSLLAKQSDALEEALWTAIRALEERAELSRRLAERVKSRNVRTNSPFALRLEEQARDAERQAKIIRDVLTDTHLRQEEDLEPEEPGDDDQPAE